MELVGKFALINIRPWCVMECAQNDSLQMCRNDTWTI